MFHVTTMNLNNIPKSEDNSVDFKTDFFGKETNLTVSGQLEGELGALSLGDIILSDQLSELKIQILQASCRILDD